MRVRAMALRARRWPAIALSAAALTAPGGSAPVTAFAAAATKTPATVLVDDFEDPSAWSAHPADGVSLAIGGDAGVHGRALKLDFGFTGGGYAVARKAVALDLPENWEFRFRVKGQCLPNHLEFKLIDSSGENVWWSVRRDFRFPTDWTPFTVKKRQVSFAWGPLGGGEIRHVAAIEIVVTAGKGGKGTVSIDDLELIPLPPPGTRLPAPVITASSARPGHAASAAFDGDPSTTWSPGPADAGAWIALDLGGPHEYGGLALDWAPGRGARGYVVEADDGEGWRELRAVTGGNGGRDYLSLPDGESRRLRLRLTDFDRDAGLREIRVEPVEWSSTREQFFAAIAADAPRGSYPRGISGEQSYWTVVGTDGGGGEALLSEDGALEVGKNGFSLEPFLRLEGRLVTWADVRSEQALQENAYPLPRVTWHGAPVELTVRAFAAGDSSSPWPPLLASYTVANTGERVRRVTLYVAIRPFQVDPPTQFLNNPGGTARIENISRAGDLIHVSDGPDIRTLVPATAFGATTFDGGDIVSDWLRCGRVPEGETVHDDFGAASAALAYSFDLAPGADREIGVCMASHAGLPVPSQAMSRSWYRDEWATRMHVVEIDAPSSAATVVESLRSQLGYILVDRRGPALQPGARSYARSWIRDGALTASALCRLGRAGVARQFLEWYAPYQYENGKVPCVVDSRGADPVPEHDSSGELVFLVAETYRYAGDRALAERMWPQVLRAVAYLDSLRQERRTEEYRTPEKAEFFGILPPSISHEGYSAKPMHSYWDDFFAYRAFRDAAYLAAELGKTDDQARLAALRDEFGADLAASVAAAMRRHKIDYVPGCADLGDFDATSTTIALSPTSAADLLPRDAVERTFERYWQFFRARAAGASWDAFTPYEIRNIGAFVRLGWRERADSLLTYFLAAQRPEGWRQWPEVVWRDRRAPHFLGDLPHTWVGSDYIRSVLDMLAYQREKDDALVIGAGIPARWLAAPGVTVRDLPTPYGMLAFTMRRAPAGGIETSLDGALRVPPGGIVLRPPLDRPAHEALVDGVAVPIGEGGEVVVRKLPARVIVR
ncbi:MAG: discoidin domain-containing protein [bacterium]